MDDKSTIDTIARRGRGENFLQSERDVFFKNAEKYKAILDFNGRSKEKLKEKADAWHDLTNDYNSDVGIHSQRMVSNVMGI